MVIQTLYKSGALGTGAQLWICSEITQSYWTQTIDWYLNFQISRSKTYTPPPQAPELQKLLEEYETPEVNSQLTHLGSPTLLASQGNLPSEQLIEMPLVNSSEEWLHLAYRIWKNLNAPPLRLFLPNFLPVTEFELQWPGRTEDHDLTVVPALYEES